MLFCLKKIPAADGQLIKVALLAFMTMTLLHSTYAASEPEVRGHELRCE